MRIDSFYLSFTFLRLGPSISLLPSLSHSETALSLLTSKAVSTVVTRIAVELGPRKRSDSERSLNSRKDGSENIAIV